MKEYLISIQNYILEIPEIPQGLPKAGFPTSLLLDSNSDQIT